jgi:signal transduction histidine kinase
MFSGGPVVRPDLLAVLTQPFQRGTTVGQGRGLGLAIVNSIMQQVGGALRMSSPPEGPTAGFEALLIFPQSELASRGLLTEPTKRRQLSSTKPLEATTVGICDDGAITPRQGVGE